MIGEREDILNENQYGNLTMRSYIIDGNEINAFYDDADDLVFVLDNTINQTKPNVLLVINPSGDKKWDEILSGQYGIDLETVRPKQDNKYQKLDIEYSGLSVYENLINAYVAGDDLSEHLVQLNILRDSAARHSAMTRLNVANEIIAKTNVTIVKTKESIVRLQNRVKTLRTKLSATKKEIGKVSTKQSAAKILKLESQIEATNEKLKRAQKRLESAQKRLETATVDAELASDLLNQPALEITSGEKIKPVMVAPKYELQTTENESDEYTDDQDDEDFEYDQDDEDDDENNEIKPLFDENPNNLNEEIAFKPIDFDAPAVPSISTNDKPVPVFTPTPIIEDIEEETITEDFDAPNINDDVVESKPVLESMIPVDKENPRPVLESMTPVVSKPITQETVPTYSEQQTPELQTMDVKPEYSDKIAAPTVPVAAPVPPVVNTFNADVTTSTSRSKPTFIYYMLLIVLIALSVFTLWLYQKNMDTTEPLLTPDVSENTVSDSQPKPMERLKTVTKQVKEIKPVKVQVQEPAPDEYEFVDEEINDSADADVNDVAIKDETKAQSGETETNDTEINESENIVAEEPVPETQESVAPVIENAVPARILTSGESLTKENVDINESGIDKPVYEVGSKYDDMIISNQDYNVSGPDSIESEMDYDEEHYEE